ncbi:Hypothetical predicted protein [Paramuricea clavata]|uniref:Uncharacterized protein n=1 Tax=Paramuricea clavata TaxID=317549 RepID=A0A6S7HAW3_PARCT|nr:Hypothetical predicted protein [Paramuricea clavata]
MTSNTTQREIIDKSSIKDPHERSEELSNVELDVSTEEGQLVQACTSTTEGEATIESYIAAEHQPAIHIDHSGIIIIITAGSKDNSNASEVLDVISLSKELANMPDMNITNNGVIIIGEHIQLNFGVQSSNTIKDLIRKIQGKTEASPDQLQPILDGKELDDGQSNKNMKYGASNRSEFCLVPNTSQL